MIEELHLRYGSWLDLVCGAALLLVVVIGIALVANARRRRVLAIFGVDAIRARDWLRACASRRRRRAWLLVLALGLCGVAMMQPRGDPEQQEFRVEARDLAIVLDVSRSMLAEDLRPNRLERMKDAIASLADDLRGTRVGLIAFAGGAETICPLTSNYSYFKSALRNVTTESAERGGTEIGDAVRKAVRLLGYSASGDDEAQPRDGDDDSDSDSDSDSEIGRRVLDDEERRNRRAFADILLITDGENHGIDPGYAVRDARAQGIEVYIAGVGSPDGTTIPIRGPAGRVELLKYKGEVVRTRLDDDGLANLAGPHNYIRVRTDNVDLASIYDEVIAARGGREIVEQHQVFSEYFQPFLLSGLGFYLLFIALAERPRRQRSARWIENDAGDGESRDDTANDTASRAESNAAATRAEARV